MYVFEAPIDLLSYLTLNPENWQKHSYIAMNGVYENAVLTALETHKNLSEIVICTDNDEGGIDAADRLKERGYADILRKTPTLKDWNEDLKSLNGVQAIAAVPHKRKILYAETVSELQYFKCNPDRMIDRISKTYDNQQYRYLAEYALAASAFFIGKKDEKSMFEKLKNKLSNEYRAYADKGRMSTKRDDLKSAFSAVMRDLRQNQSRTKEEIIQTAKQLFQLADYAVKCEVEQDLSKPQLAQKESPQMEDLSEAMCLHYG